jgi:hypothetical protein
MRLFPTLLTLLGMAQQMTLPGHPKRPEGEAPWQNAKTYAAAPHEYLRRSPETEPFFAYYLGKIREEGVRETFTLRGKTHAYRYYCAEGWRYWRIGPWILNRAKVAPEESGRKK